MAKAKKETKPAAKGKKDANGKGKKKPAETVAGGYDVNDLAELLDCKPASARIKLRAANVKKEGKGYHWETRGELQKVAKQLGA